jgi:hypothetical protein
MSEISQKIEYLLTQATKVLLVSPKAVPSYIVRRESVVESMLYSQSWQDASFNTFDE